jgi:hypothetical protein
VGEVLRLFDGPVYGERSKVVLDLVDASALLWRLHLRGVDVGDRWAAVADGWEPVAAEGSSYAFNDAHAVMAFVGAGRPDRVRAVLDAQERAMAAGRGDNAAAFLREVGAPVARALAAFGEGDHRAAVRLLRPVREAAHRFGGSHAQRDLIDLTLIEAALRVGELALARALAAERAEAKPASPTGPAFLKRALAAAAARDHHRAAAATAVAA